jgi:hypothetical protein
MLILKDIEVPNDDLLDIADTTEKIVNCINEIYSQNETHIAASAFFSAISKILVCKCRNIPELLLYRFLIMVSIEEAKGDIKLKEQNESNT